MRCSGRQAPLRPTSTSRSACIAANRGLEAELIWKRSGRTSIGLLQSLGVISSRALLPHAVDLGGPQADPVLVDHDIDALARSGGVVVHCPLVVGRGGKRLHALGTLLARGVLVGLGTDTAPPDMLMNLQMGVAMARCGASVGGRSVPRSSSGRRPWTEPRRSGGRISAGSSRAQRRISCVWDLSSLDVRPFHDPIQALFLMPPGRRARDVFVAGRQVVRDARLTGVDEDALGADLQAIFDKLRGAYPERDPDGSPWPTMFPSTFPSRGIAVGHQLQREGN